MSVMPDTGGSSGNGGGSGGGGGGNANASGGSSTSAGVLAWLQFAANYVQSQKKGTFVQPPMSPEQRAMFNWAMGQLTSMPSTGGVVNPILQYDIAHPATIDMQAIRDGKVGYQPASHMPTSDIAALIRSQPASASGSAPGSYNAAPPPTAPPPDPVAIHEKHKYRHRALGILKGAVGGLLSGGPYGAVAGAVMGGVQDKQKQNAQLAGQRDAASQDWYSQNPNLPWETDPGFQTWATAQGASQGQLAKSFVNRQLSGSHWTPARQLWDQYQASKGTTPTPHVGTTPSWLDVPAAPAPTSNPYPTPGAASGYTSNPYGNTGNP